MKIYEGCPKVYSRKNTMNSVVHVYSAMYVIVSADFLADFTVYVSDISIPPPNDRPFSEPDYHVCATYASNPPAGTQVNIVCQPGPVKGTHLYIQQSGTDKIILCEVEVYGFQRGK